MKWKKACFVGEHILVNNTLAECADALDSMEY